LNQINSSCFEERKKEFLRVPWSFFQQLSISASSSALSLKEVVLQTFSDYPNSNLSHHFLYDLLLEENFAK